MTPQTLQSIKHSASSVSTTATGNITTVEGSSVLVSVGVRMSGGGSVPDIAFAFLDGGAYTLTQLVNVAGRSVLGGLDLLRHAIYKIDNVPPGTHSVTVIFAQQVQFVTIFVTEVNHLTGDQDGLVAMVFGNSNTFHTDPRPLPITDDFNRADENPIAGNWQCEVLSSPPLPAAWGLSELSDGKVWGLGNFSNPVYWKNSQGPDTYVQAKAYGLPWPGIFTRLQPGEGTAYFHMWPDRATATLYRFNGGSDFVALLSVDMHADPLADGDTLRMETEGSGATVIIRIYKNDVLIGTKNDNDPDQRILTPGKLGIHADGVHAAGLDDFAAGPLVYSAPADPLAYWYGSLFAVQPSTIAADGGFDLSISETTPSRLGGAITSKSIPESLDLASSWILGDGSKGYIGLAVAFVHVPDPPPPIDPVTRRVRFLQQTFLDELDAAAPAIIRPGVMGYKQSPGLYGFDEVAIFPSQQALDIIARGDAVEVDEDA